MLPRNRSRSGVRAGVKPPHMISWTCCFKLTSLPYICDAFSKSIESGRRGLAATLLSNTSAVRRHLAKQHSRNGLLPFFASALRRRLRGHMRRNADSKKADASAHRGDDLQLPRSQSQEPGEPRRLRAQRPHAQAEAHLRRAIEGRLRSSRSKNDARAAKR
jgi:hypothetical protein